MSEHPEILAKSEQHGRITLFQHLKNVAEVAAVMAGHLNLDKQTAIEGAWLHDIGKASPMFQRSLDKDYKRKPGYVFRHEIASILFVSLIEKPHRDNVIDMVIGHHKSVRNDVGGKGIIDLDDYNEDCFEEHIKGFEDWSKNALEILDELGMKVHPITLDIATENYEYVVDYCAKRRIECSVWRGLLMGADHMASALETEGKIHTEKLFVLPDLSFYDRSNPLFPLSQISAEDNKPHTLVSAPTGAGKTDFLLRRCRGRVFYTLPFQASINAMYERIKHDLADTDAQIRLLHATSSLKIEDGHLEERIMQRMMGASIKIMTPHQMASMVFGIKGYESMALDLRGCDVILDEIHTYSDTIQAIVLRIIEILVALGCRIHVGTATMPTMLYNKILALLGGTNNVYEVKLPAETLNTFNRHQIYKLPCKDGMDAIIEKAIENKQKILIVCNQVKRAQEVYRQIEEKFPKVTQMLVHSRFKRCDRNQKEHELINVFNTIEQQPCIVVSTQVVEVSLDINFDLMITECAPIDALIQRFGRINRKRTSETIGHFKPVYVLAPPIDKTEALPYTLDVLKRTFKVLPNNGEVLYETSVQKMIDMVYPYIELANIDFSGAAFIDGKWQLQCLCNKAKSALLDTLDINSAICITESDKETYCNCNVVERSKLEIPVSYRSIAYRNLEQIAVGHSRPFIIPNSAYNDNWGLSTDMCKVENYQSFEIL